MNKIQIATFNRLECQAHLSPHGNWIGKIDALGICMEADSLDELHSVMYETINLMLFDLLMDNELEAFLKEKGWSIQGALPQIKDESDRPEFDIPWYLVAEADRDSARNFC